jgi:SNF2 family DNA or RNA helicase
LSPKLCELEDILFEKLDISNSNRKVIIFSEWIRMHKLIGEMLRKHKVGFTELNGTVPVKARGDLIKSFEADPGCKVFLSTEAGGVSEKPTDPGTGTSAAKWNAIFCGAFQDGYRYGP